MSFLRRMPPSARKHACAGLWTLSALGWATAQPVDALRAADPQQPVQTQPLVLPPTTTADTPALPSDLAAARDVWQRANQRVAEFPRGHADLLRWEAQQPPGDAPPAAKASTDLDFAQALRQSLRHRPELFTHADMNDLARAQVQARYAAHVRDLQRAWIDAVATRQRERLLNDALDATRTGSELGRRMVSAGNWSQVRQMREQLIEANAWQASANARGDTLAAQERLARLLGDADAQAVARLSARLPNALPELPPQPAPGEAMGEAAVLRSHPTLAQTRLLAARDLAAVSPARRQAWNETVETALRSLQTSTPPHIDNLSLLRDGTLERSIDAETRLRQLAVERRSMAREAWTTLQLRHASARHAQDVVIKLQAAVEQETQLRYNGMLQSTWELLASARERMASLDTALQARRDYWTARADWQALLGGADAAAPTPSSATGAASTAAPAGH
ncbi:TolC family protein [Hydrogenophaga sp. BPS33]|uniref:TolC family protein n=1 Tax=Hydrogenophaga sp. BPS33 TaxID=2651974 RepID=UPI00131F92C1|nr:hypothetical protein [Hydrogenophaga sp. BPS33]QHE85333.1 TolC family protein [Hydrogenophaga sp. BPS33]